MRIRGGIVVTPAGARQADIRLAAGRIAAIEEPRGGAGLDAGGCYVLPGGVDPHTHILPDVAAASVAASRGGTTSVLSFTAPRPGELPAAAWRRARKELLPAATVDVRLHPSIWEPERLMRDDLEALRAAGARSVKLFLAYGELGMQASDRVLIETLRAARELGLLVQLHCETGETIAALVAAALAAGRTGAAVFAETRPPEAEEDAVGRALALAARAGAPVYLVHLSTAGALDRVREARARGQTVWAEACTHHLALDDSVYRHEEASRFLVAPPLRAREHVEALWDALADGTIDAVGSDHAQEQYRPPPAPDFTGLPYGLAGVEERLPVLLSLGLARGLPVERLAELLAAGPARAFGLSPRKGAIAPGSDADLVIWDPRGSTSFRHGVYAGLELRGSVRAVLRAGEPVAGLRLVGID